MLDLLFSVRFSQTYTLHFIPRERRTTHFNSLRLSFLLAFCFPAYEKTSGALKNRKPVQWTNVFQRLSAPSPSSFVRSPYYVQLNVYTYTNISIYGMYTASAWPFISLHNLRCYSFIVVSPPLHPAPPQRHLPTRNLTRRKVN